MNNRVVHKSIGSYGKCGRFLRDSFLRTTDDTLVTCAICKAGGMSHFKLKNKDMSAHNHDEEIINSFRRIGPVEQLNNALSESNKQKWDKILTDAIELTEGQIQPYDRILKYLSSHYRFEKV